MYIADRKAREAVETRATLEKKLAQKDKEKKESKLRELAEKARMERSGLKEGICLVCPYFLVFELNKVSILP